MQPIDIKKPIENCDRLFRLTAGFNLTKKVFEKMDRMGKRFKPELVNELLTKWVNEPD